VTWAKQTKKKIYDYCDDLDFFTEYEKMGTYLDEQKTKINFLKFHNIGQMLTTARQCQEIRYSFKVVDGEMKWLQNSTVVMELNDVVRLSERCEH
jgi:hypothetical protein